ncbi:MAG: hypothetical protein JXA69_21195 [Phycisphaerae bacterium]|nr:hypothetical protein [Phycisphaerae bacterium]
MAAGLLVALGCAPTAAPSPCGEWGVDCSGQPVVAYAGRDQSVVLAAGASTAPVVLDGTGSFSNLGLTLEYEWRAASDAIATGPKPQVDLATGAHSVVLIVTDSQGNLASDTVAVTVTSGGGGGSGCGALGPPIVIAMFVGLSLLKLANDRRR